MNATSRMTVDTGAGGASVRRLREEVGEALERQSRLLVQSRMTTGPSGGAAADVSGLQAAVRFLGQVASAWHAVPDGALPEDAAGFGSTLQVEDMDGRRRETYTLMTGALLDIDAGQVSLASPLGQALLGTRPGSIVRVQTPQRQRTLCVISVETLYDRVRALTS